MFTKTVAIAAGQTVSGLIFIDEAFSIVGIQTDAAFLEADIILTASQQEPYNPATQGNIDPATVVLVPVYDSGKNRVMFQCPAGAAIVLATDNTMIVGNWFKLTSSVAQTAGTVLTIMFGEV